MAVYRALLGPVTNFSRTWQYLTNTQSDDRSEGTPRAKDGGNLECGYGKPLVGTGPDHLGKSLVGAPLRRNGTGGAGLPQTTPLLSVRG